MRLGLCCLFREAPIKFRTLNVKNFQKLGIDVLAERILENVNALLQAIEFCEAHDIGAFRISSDLLPLYDHPTLAYTIEDLKYGEAILEGFSAVKARANEYDVRLSFHPDQFVVLSSPNPTVVENSIRALEYHGDMAEWFGGDVINIHGGGGYGDKRSALERFSQNFKRLSPSVQSRLTVENDDKTYTPEDLLPLCHALKIPFVYDVHHHRCHPDGLSVEEATGKALETWDREPLFHISSPIEGWKGPKPQRHHDYIDPKDFPACWKTIDPLTVDVEAKAKELAIFRLSQAIRAQK